MSRTDWLFLRLSLTCTSTVSSNLAKWRSFTRAQAARGSYSFSWSYFLTDSLYFLPCFISSTPSRRPSSGRCRR